MKENIFYNCKIKIFRGFAILLQILCVYSASADQSVRKVENTSTSIHQIFNNRQSVDYESLFSDVIDKVKEIYVEDVGQKHIFEASIAGLLSSLDPYSTFYNEKDFAKLQMQTNGEFGGIGCEMMMEKHTLKVVSPYEDGPAFKAGIRSGDVITAIDDQQVKGMSFSDAIEKLRGKPRTKVKVRIFREDLNENMDIVVTRDIVKIMPVKAMLLQHDVALIKIMNFNANTADSVFKEYLKLSNQAKERGKQIKGLVLDLRWNPGGLLDQAVQVASLFLNDKMIVTIKGKVDEYNKTYKSNGSDITDGIPIVVLINGGSASCSEIVAGALQDHERALVMGTKSFGKGSVQTVFPMPGDTAIKLTTALYYTPNGRSIHLKGIEPDIVVDEAIVTPVYANDPINEESSKNNMRSQDLRVTSQAKKSVASKTILLNGAEKEDYQLVRAIDTVKGMALYGKKSYE